MFEPFLGFSTNKSRISSLNIHKNVVFNEKITLGFSSCVFLIYLNISVILLVIIPILNKI